MTPKAPPRAAQGFEQLPRVGKDVERQMRVDVSERPADVEEHARYCHADYEAWSPAIPQHALEVGR
jgi:hypothetical protein